MNLVTLFLGSFLAIFLTYIVIDKFLKKRWFPIHSKIASRIKRFIENFHVSAFQIFVIDFSQKKYTENDLEAFKEIHREIINLLPQKINDFFKLDKEGLEQFVAEMDKFQNACEELIDIVSLRDMPYEYNKLLEINNFIENMVTISNQMLAYNEYSESNNLKFDLMQSIGTIREYYKITLTLLSDLKEHIKNEYKVKMWYEEKN